MASVKVHLYQHDIGWQEMNVEGERTAAGVLLYLRALFGVMGHNRYCSAVHPDYTRDVKIILAVDDVEKARRIFEDRFGTKPCKLVFEGCFGRPVLRKMKVSIYGVKRVVKRGEQEGEPDDGSAGGVHSA